MVSKNEEATVKIRADLSQYKIDYETAKRMMNELERHRRRVLENVRTAVSQSITMFNGVQRMAVDMLRAFGIVLTAHDQAVLAAITTTTANFVRMATAYAETGAISGNVLLLGVATALSAAAMVYNVQATTDANRRIRETEARLAAAERVLSTLSMLRGGY